MTGAALPVVRALLARLAPAELRQDLLFDLESSHAMQARVGGAAAADRWAWAQLTGSVAPLLIARLHGRAGRRGLLALGAGTAAGMGALLAFTRGWEFLLSCVPLRAGHDAPAVYIVAAIIGSATAAWWACLMTHTLSTSRRSS